MRANSPKLKSHRLCRWIMIHAKVVEPLPFCMEIILPPKSTLPTVRAQSSETRIPDSMIVWALSVPVAVLRRSVQAVTELSQHKFVLFNVFWLFEIRRSARCAFRAVLKWRAWLVFLVRILRHEISVHLHFQIPSVSPFKPSARITLSPA